MHSPNVLVVPACILIIDDDVTRIEVVRERLQKAFREDDEVVALGSMEWLNDSAELAKRGPLRTVLVGRWKGWEQTGIREKLVEAYPDVPFYFIDGNKEADDGDPAAAELQEDNPINTRLRSILRSDTDTGAANPAKSSWLFRGLSGTSPAIQSVNNDISLVGAGDTTVLICGNPGTGKEIVARNIHFQSPRRLKPFVPVQCGESSAEQLEIELFGEERTAAGGNSDRKGRFEIADGGTLFLDDIGDMPLAMQVKLVRVLQEKMFERVGGGNPRPVNVRIIAATHRNLEALVAEGGFRKDLHHRLGVFPIRVPDLKDRIEDLPVLIEEIQRKFKHTSGGVRFTPDAFRALRRYRWPANLRELSLLIERLSQESAGREVDVPDLPAEFLQEDATKGPALTYTPLFHPDGLDLERYLGDMEGVLIRRALEETNGALDRAAALLKLNRDAMLSKMTRHGISMDDFRPR